MNDMRRVHAEQLVSSLELSLPPVAIAFCDVVPDDVPMFEGVVPAGCAFWSQATSRTFATAARDHALCAIGIHTHNLSGAAASQPDELHASLKAMMGLDYVREEEIPAIPVMPRPRAHALYGPLADFPVQPEVVLVFAHAQHGLILSEAVARVDGGTPPAMGRPAVCHRPAGTQSAARGHEPGVLRRARLPRCLDGRRGALGPAGASSRPVLWADCRIR